MDQNIEEAARAAVVRSVGSISKLLVGDKKTDLSPLFIVTLVLDTNQRIELKPTVQVTFSSTWKLVAVPFDRS